MATTVRLKENLIPSLADLFFITVLFSLFFTGRSSLLSDGDTAYHLRVGEEIIKSRSIPRFDMFSQHAPPLPWTAHEWLSEVLMAAVHDRLGITGIVACSALLLAATSYLLFMILRSYRCNLLTTTAIAVLALVTSQQHWLARPHIFSFPLMLAFHHLVASWHAGGKNRLHLLPHVMILWVNLHGGYLAGFIILGAYLLGNLATLATAADLPPAKRSASLRKLGQLAAAGAACLAACLVNPYGYRILIFPFQLVSDQFIMDHVQEFLSPDFHHWLPFKYLLLLMMALLARSAKSADPSEVVLILIFSYMALYSARYIPLFALVTAPMMTRMADEAAGRIGGRAASFFRERLDRFDRNESRARGLLWPAIAVGAVAVAIGTGHTSHAFDRTQMPVDACEFLMKTRIAGNMFNSDGFGDYLVYRGYPAYRVFIDGRLDVYGCAKVKEYNRVIDLEPEWESVLEKYRVDWILFPAQSKFSRFLHKDRNWVLVYSDPVANIFVRKLPQYQQLIASYRTAHPEGAAAK